MILTEWKLSLPSWVGEWERQHQDKRYHQLDDRLRFTLELAKENILRKTGGPFSAVIFQDTIGEVVSIGVNHVIAENCSMAHAEIMAIMAAQKKLHAFDLGSPEMPSYHLISSAQPCAMCTGAIPWSGIRKLTYISPKEDVQDILGFDEGPLHPQWVQEFKKRHIDIQEGSFQEEAKAILILYKKLGGPIYNGRGGTNYI